MKKNCLLLSIMIILGFSSGNVFAAAALTPIEQKIEEARRLSNNIPARIAIFTNPEYALADRRNQLTQCAADVERLKALNLGFFDPKYPAKVARLEKAFETAFLFSN